MASTSIMTTKKLDVDFGTIIETAWIAAFYILAARISQLYAIEPGNITPVWIPSGLILALALYRGTKVAVGVFLGAFFGNIWAYFSSDSLSTSLAAIFSAAMNGLGDVLASVGIAIFILRICRTRYPVHSLQEFSWFIALGAIAGPGISAIMGVGSLTLFGFIPFENFASAFMTWFIGDAVGVLLFTPLILSWLNPEQSANQRYVPQSLILNLFAILVTAYAFDMVDAEKWLTMAGVIFLPVAFILIIQSSQRTVFTIQATVAATAIYATSYSMGPFGNLSQAQAFLELQVFIAIFSVTLFSITVLANRRQMMEYELTKQKQELEKLYRSDALTGLWNRYRIQEFMQHELHRFRRVKHPFGLLILDIDDFKKINDSLGHLMGDKVLVELSELINKYIRADDLFGRWGGEEFIIIVCDTNKESLKVLAEKILVLVREHKFSIGQPVTVSIGGTLSEKGDSELQLVDRADNALYEAKANGKDQVRFFG